MDNPAQTMVDLLTRGETIVAFLIFIVPGFISLRTYEVIRGGEPRKINESLIDVVIYSFATDVLWAALFYLGSIILPSQAQAVASVLALPIALIATPIVLAWAWWKLQRRLARSGAIADPTAKPWDKIFNRVVSEKRDVGLILTLPDGRKLGGRYVDPGFASSYPADEQLLVGETWKLNQETGAFEARVVGTYGFLIDKKDVLTIEFVDWPAVERTVAEEIKSDARSDSENRQ